MKDTKGKLLIVHFLTGLIASVLLGIIETQLLLDKPQLYRENMIWKYTLLFYALTMIYTLWIYFFKNYIPIISNMFKFLGLNLLLSLPYYAVLVLMQAISIIKILANLPALMVLLATAFIWHVANEIDPELEKRTNKIMLVGFFIGAIAFFTTGFLGLTDSLALFLGSLIPFGYTLIFLIRVKKS